MIALESSSELKFALLLINKPLQLGLNSEMKSLFDELMLLGLVSGLLKSKIQIFVRVQIAWAGLELVDSDGAGLFIS